MKLIETTNATDAVLQVFTAIRDDGQFIGKTQDLLDVHLVIENPLHAFTYMKKQHWVWALYEISDRLNPDFENPGQAYRFRPAWQKKLVKEEGAFCYTYGAVYRAQLPVILKKLRSKQTREAIINVWSERFIFEENDRTPCTLTLHFLVRDSKLHLFVNMRTNDAINLLIYDALHHCLLQRYIAAKLGLGLGAYHHQANHVYVPKRRISSGNLERTIHDLEKSSAQIQENEAAYYTDEDFQSATLDADMEAHYLSIQAARRGDFESAIHGHERIQSAFVKDWTATLVMAEGNSRGYKPAIPVVLPDLTFICKLGYHLRGR